MELLLRYLAVVLLASLIPAHAAATTIILETNLGDIDIELFDSATPVTVQNFLGYVESGAYTSTLIHRSHPDFVIFGGGVKYMSGDFSLVPTNDPIVNESSISNVRGTLGMAQLGLMPDSAQSQWYINVVDNIFLDDQRFTIFGQVSAQGMEIVDLINDLNICDESSILGLLHDLPVDGSCDNYNFDTDLVIVNHVRVVPLPASIWILVSGALVLTGVARRT